MLHQNVHSRFHAHPIVVFLDAIDPMFYEISGPVAHLEVLLTLKSKTLACGACENLVFSIDFMSKTPSVAGNRL